MKPALVFTLETGTNYPIHPQPAVDRSRSTQTECALLRSSVVYKIIVTPQRSPQSTVYVHTGGTVSL